METDQEITTSVSIHNQTYLIRCVDPAHAERLAAFLDERMRKVSSQTATVDSLKVAVLAALNIVDDYLGLRDRMESLERRVVDRSQAMAEALDESRSPVGASDQDGI